MTSILFLGLFIGMSHALEADHVAAVASIATGERSFKRIIRLGAVWGMGHTLTLLAFGAAVVGLGSAVPAGLAAWLELAVGFMLVILGGHVLYLLVRDRIHFHLHRHGDGVAHLHAHSHRGEVRAHDPARHEHEHPRGVTLRALLVGVMHGMAGSAALLLLSAAALGSAPLGMIYIALFGLGSIAGMAALSAVIAVPLTYSAGVLTWANSGLRAAVGAATIGIGLHILMVSPI